MLPEGKHITYKFGGKPKREERGRKRGVGGMGRETILLAMNRRTNIYI